MKKKKTGKNRNGTETRMEQRPAVPRVDDRSRFEIETTNLGVTENDVHCIESVPCAGSACSAAIYYTLFEFIPGR